MTIRPGHPTTRSGAPRLEVLVLVAVLGCDGDDHVSASSSAGGSDGSSTTVAGTGGGGTATSGGGTSASGSGATSGPTGGGGGEGGGAGGGATTGAATTGAGGAGPLVPTGVAVGSSHSCVTLSDATAYCWGLDEHSKLGTSGGPGLVLLDDVARIDGGARHTCALRNDGTVWCVGDNAAGQLGDGTNVASSTFVQAEGIATATHISVKGDSSCALLGDGTARCWGEGTAGALGGGRTADSSVPVDFGLDAIEQIAAGGETTCARLEGGSVWCAGEGSSGELGDGLLADSSTPVEVDGLADAIDIDTGTHHSCALDSAGTVACWGWNNYGQLGNGTNGSWEASPVEVVDLQGAVDVGVGEGLPPYPYGMFSCAIVDDGRMRCWGHALYGQLGNGETSPQWRTSPVDVSVLTDVVAMDLGGVHVAALTGAGEVFTWGGCNCAAISTTPMPTEPAWLP